MQYCICCYYYNLPDSIRAGLEGGSILSALEVSRGVSTLANNAVHLNMLDERVNTTELGDLVMQVRTYGRVAMVTTTTTTMQELFGSQEGQKQLYKERRIFLFEKALIITKRRHDNTEKESYVVKEKLVVSIYNCSVSMVTSAPPSYVISV